MKSIATRTGDAGTTSLMFNRRVPKDHPRVKACGAVDELNASIGLARAHLAEPDSKKRLAGIQQELIILMGEVATLNEDLSRYHAAGFQMVKPEMTKRLDTWLARLERDQPPPAGWLLPGEDIPSATLHVARTICRRAEREVAVLQATGDLPDSEALIYLNRLGDLLWLLARQIELDQAEPHSKG